MSYSIDELKKQIIGTAKDSGITLKFSDEFDKLLKKIKDNHIRGRLYKQILKIVENPAIGKPMRYSRKGEREVYLDSFRLYYKLYEVEGVLRFVEFSHKDEQ